MADNLLQGTLSGTTPTPPNQIPPTPVGLTVPETPMLDKETTNKQIQSNINKLLARQEKPNSLLDFQKVMQLSSSLAYKERQASELKIEGTAFDPTKVSGGTFASIISMLEANRGADVTKVYASTLNTYVSVQQEITRRLESLEQLKEEQRQFDMQMNYKEKELKRLKKLDKQNYELEKAKFDEQVDEFNKEFAFKVSKIGSGTSSSENLKNISAEAYSSFVGQVKGGQSYADGYQYLDERGKYIAAGGNAYDFDKQYSSFLSPGDQVRFVSGYKAPSNTTTVYEQKRETNAAIANEIQRNQETWNAMSNDEKRTFILQNGGIPSDFNVF